MDKSIASLKDVYLHQSVFATLNSVSVELFKAGIDGQISVNCIIILFATHFQVYVVIIAPKQTLNVDNLRCFRCARTVTWLGVFSVGYENEIKHSGNWFIAFSILCRGFLHNNVSGACLLLLFLRLHNSRTDVEFILVLSLVDCFSNSFISYSLKVSTSSSIYIKLSNFGSSMIVWHLSDSEAPLHPPL